MKGGCTCLGEALVKSDVVCGLGDKGPGGFLGFLSKFVKVTIPSG